MKEEKEREWRRRRGEESSEDEDEEDDEKEKDEDEEGSSDKDGVEFQSGSEEDSDDEEGPRKAKGAEGLIAIENPNRSLRAVTISLFKCTIFKVRIFSRKPQKQKKVTAIEGEDSGASASAGPEKPQLSRREREEIERQRAKAHYQKLHAEGKTEEARADLAR